jgi:hypothetical protein
MKPLHVDDINKQGKKGKLSPGPGAYKDGKTFSKEGLQFSFRAHLNAETVGLRKAEKLPGPGSYGHADVLGRGVQSSLKPNSTGQVIGKAQDRFKTPINRKLEPSGANYSPKWNLADESIFKKSAKAVMGKQNFSILDSNFNKREMD